MYSEQFQASLAKVEQARESNLAYEPKRMTAVHGDASAPASMVLVEARRGGAPGLTYTPPLLLYRDPPAVTPRVMTEQAARIYASGSFMEN